MKAVAVVGYATIKNLGQLAYCATLQIYGTSITLDSRHRQVMNHVGPYRWKSVTACFLSNGSSLRFSVSVAALASVVEAASVVTSGNGPPAPDLAMITVADSCPCLSSPRPMLNCCCGCCCFSASKFSQKAIKKKRKGLMIIRPSSLKSVGGNDSKGPARALCYSIFIFNTIYLL